MEIRNQDVEAVNLAMQFLDNSQLRHNPPQMDRTHRHPTRGGWPYSTHDQGYIVSDVTSETCNGPFLCHRPLHTVISCGYRYPLYKFHFTLKALGMYAKRYGDGMAE